MEWSAGKTRDLRYFVIFNAGTLSFTFIVETHDGFARLRKLFIPFAVIRLLLTHTHTDARARARARSGGTRGWGQHWRYNGRL